MNKYFLEMFTEQIKLNIEDYVGKKCTVKVDQQEKNNVTLNAVTIIPEGTIVGTVLYVEPYYEASCNAVSMPELVKKALETIKKGIEDAPVVDMDMLRDYEQVKGKLSVDLISAKNNERILGNVPHQLVEDMAAVYRINLDCGAVSGTALITNQMMEHYRITQEQLHADAIHNAAIIKPFCITNLHEIVKLSAPQWMRDEWEIEEIPVNESLFVATVPDKTRGAGVLLYDNFMDYAAEKLGGDFFVLPSSIHEVLLVKDDGKTYYQQLKETVIEVNRSQISPEDKLTDSVYHYDSRNRIFELGEKFQNRGLREPANRNKDSQSVRRRLKENLAFVSEKEYLPKTEKSISKAKGGEVL